MRVKGEGFQRLPKEGMAEKMKIRSWQLSLTDSEQSVKNKPVSWNFDEGKDAGVIFDYLS